MSELIMIMNKFGRFVGKEPNKKEAFKDNSRIDLKDAVEMVTMAGREGPMISGAILGYMAINDIDMVVYLDSKSTYYNVYHQCTSNIVLAKEKSIIIGK